MKIDEPLVLLGGGVKSIFVARYAVNYFENIFLLEQFALLGEGQTNHSSGIAHTGVNYKDAPFKTRFCIDGNEGMMQYAVERNRRAPGSIKFRRNGKIIIARTRRETELLMETKEHAQQEGIPVIQLTLEQIKQKEPYLAVKREYVPDEMPGARAALYLPTAGVFDTGDVMRAAREDVEAAGVTIYTNTKVQRVESTEKGFRITTDKHAEPLETRLLVNALGLGAHTIAAQCGIDGYSLQPTRGEYALIKKSLLSEIIYVVKDPLSVSQGAHFMRTPHGECYYGPNAKIVDGLDYKNELDLDEAAASIQTMIPRVERNDLELGYTGIRSILVKNGKAVKDFLPIEQANGAWAMHLLNFHSPGFTSAPATAKYVVGKLLEYIG